MNALAYAGLSEPDTEVTVRRVIRGYQSHTAITERSHPRKLMARLLRKMRLTERPCPTQDHFEFSPRVQAVRDMMSSEDVSVQSVSMQVSDSFVSKLKFWFIRTKLENPAVFVMSSLVVLSLMTP